MKRPEDQPTVAFKSYQQGQGILLPQYIEDMIGADHLVRVVSAAVESLDISALVARYPGGGAGSYHPLLMLKILIYAYCERIYTSRRIAKALRENIHFMWLSGRATPDFRTIARFRCSRLAPVIAEVFAAVVRLLLEAGHVQLRHYFVDGTKMDANAGRYTHVWRKSVQRYHDRLDGQVRQLLEQIAASEAAEAAALGDEDLPGESVGGRISSEQIRQAVERVGARIAADPQDRAARRIKKKIEGDLLPRAERYEQQQELLDGRNSYSRTDPDATFMRMKDDHRGDAPPRPAYNVQQGTENHFIVGYSIHRNSTDTTCLIAHLQELADHLGSLPQVVVADAGYGSFENYEYLQEHGVVAYIKDQYFQKDHVAARRGDAFVDDTWPYDAAGDSFTCPAGHRLGYRRTQEKASTTGHRSAWRIYDGAPCGSCPQRQQCTPHAAKRIWRNNEFLVLRDAARERLASEEGWRLRRRRGVEVEGGFAQIKHNRGFRRFVLRGLDNVSAEWGLLCIAHNLDRLWRIAGAQQGA